MAGTNRVSRRIVPSVPEDTVQTNITDGRLIRVLADRCRAIQAVVYTTRAGANLRRHSRCWSTRCGAGAAEMSGGMLVPLPAQGGNRPRVAG
jgi:hypothetical protein